MLKGWADESLLDSFQDERHAAAAENLAVTRRTSRFLAPRSAAEHRLRRALMSLAKQHAFARTMVNAGRMSVANDYPAAPALPQGGTTVQNVPLMHADGAPTTVMQLLREAGDRALCFSFGEAPDAPDDDTVMTLRVGALADAGIDLVDVDGRLAAHLDVRGKNAVRVRPDAYRAGSLGNGA